MILATEPEHLRPALALRFDVFVAEQGVSPEDERDALDDDPSTVRLLAIGGDGGVPGAPGTGVIGVGRLLAPVPEGHPHLARVAIARSRRRAGLGRALMEAIEEAALERYGEHGSVTVALSAQVQAIPFCELIGYVVAGEVYLDEGIWHRDATKVVWYAKTPGGPAA